MKSNRFLTASAHTLPRDHSFNGIDLVKFLCAFLIVMIHIQPFPAAFLGIPHLNFFFQQYLCRVAVPFYFVSSGFLLFRKTDLYDLDTERVKSYVFKTIRLLGVWTILLFQGGHGHLWYLSALVCAVILLSVLLKKNVKLRTIAVIALVFFVIGLFGDAYYVFVKPLLQIPVPKVFIVFFDNLIPNTRNGFSFGLIFVLMGAVFAQKRIVIRRSLAVIGLAASMVLFAGEVYVLQVFFHIEAYNMFLSLLPVTFFLFYLASHMDLKNRPIYGRLRVIGLLVFFSHLFVDYFVLMALKVTDSVLGLDLAGFEFPVTVCLTVALAVLIERLSRKEKFTWLKYLYS